MMDKLLARVREDVEAELAEARKNHGDYFHSMHEGFGVLAEEAQEGADEAKHVGESMRALFYWLRMNDHERVAHILTNIMNNATLAACEYIQVAAMTHKMIASMEEEAHEREND